MTGYKSPPAKRSTIRVQIEYTNLERLAERYAAGMTWKALGAGIGVSAATVRRAVALGEYPHDNSLRSALGLPVTAPAPVCVKCGVVHLRKTCPPAQPTARRPRRTRRARNRANVRQRVAWLLTKGIHESHLLRY